MSTTFTKRAAETRTFTVSFRHKLLAEELLSGTPTVTEVSTAALTISGEALTVNPLEPVGHIFIPTDQGVSFTVAGGVSGTTYTIRITATTGESPAQTLIEEVTLRVN